MLLSTITLLVAGSALYVEYYLWLNMRNTGPIMGTEKWALGGNNNLHNSEEILTSGG